MNVGTKIGCGLGLAVAALILAGIASYRTTARLIETSHWVEHTHHVLGELERVLGALRDAETGERGYLITGMDRYLEPYARAAEQLTAGLNGVRTLTADNPHQQRRLLTLEYLAAQRLSCSKEQIELRRERGLEAASQAVMTGRGKNLMDQIRILIGDMMEMENGLLARRSLEEADSSRRAASAMVWGILLVCVASGLIWLQLVHSIARPLRETAAIAERMGTGDLSVEVNVDGRRDEVGAMLQAFARMATFQREMANVAGQISSGDLRVTIAPQSENDMLGNAFALMVTNLRQQVSDLAEASHVLGTAATEIAASTSQVRGGAAETAAAASQTSTAMEEVRQTARVSSQNVQQVACGAQQLMQTSEAGGEATDAVVAGMARIRSQMVAIADSMAWLDEQTQAIGQTIAAVDDITAQSNLLAVNAAVEAAKAGEHGKGFAVVAQEVKALADQSRQATAQVRSVLNDIQKATDAAVTATREGTRLADTGVQRSAQAREAIEALADGVGESERSASLVAASIQQQLAGMDQMAAAMGNIKQATVANVASARQMESAARDLGELGRRLQELVEQYQV